MKLKESREEYIKWSSGINRMEKYYNLKNKQKKIQRYHTIHNFFPKKIILYLFFENFIYSCNIFWSYLSKLPSSNSSEWHTHFVLFSI